jgi:hypothetical protein
MIRSVLDSTNDDDDDWQFLIAVADHSIKNRMHKDNLLTVMIPTLQSVPAIFSLAMDCFEVCAVSLYSLSLQLTNSVVLFVAVLR